MEDVAGAKQPRHRVFISYSSADRRRVDGLERLLTLFGHEVFLDFKTLRLGTRWEDEIESALEQTDVTFVYWTRSASLSTWVRREYEHFLTHHPDRPLVPIVGDETPLAEPLKERQKLTFVPVVNELLELTRSMEADGRKKVEIQAAVKKRLEEAGIPIEESDLKRVFRFLGVASWLAWLPAPLLLFQWVWRSLFEGAVQLSHAQAALMIVAAAGTVVATAKLEKMFSSHAVVTVAGIEEPILLTVDSTTGQDRFTVLIREPREFTVVIPGGSYQADYVLTGFDTVHQYADENGALVGGIRLIDQRLENGKEYVFTLEDHDVAYPSEEDEIDDRLEEVEGGSGDVQISLAWNNVNDLDLHVICPSGEEIYYDHRESACGGQLDVDMNAGEEKSNKPLENAYWPSGEAPRGEFQVYVAHYANNGATDPTEFSVRIKTDGETSTFKGSISFGEEQKLIHEFER